jgi:hypothetical protein
VECEQELSDAMPAMEAAVEALEILNQRDISTLKTMRNPPQAVRLCMEAVCILLGEVIFDPKTYTPNHLASDKNKTSEQVRKTQVGLLANGAQALLGHSLFASHPNLPKRQSTAQYYEVNPKVSWR